MNLKKMIVYHFNKNFPDMVKDTTSSGLMKQMKNDKGETIANLKGYEKNIHSYTYVWWTVFRFLRTKLAATE